MHSSTSNSDNPMPGLGSMLRLLTITLMLIGCGILFRPPTIWVNTGEPNDKYWMEKAFHSKQYNIVVAGDSRVLRGISPDVMKTMLPDRTIYNFGFDHNAYNRDYLTAVEKLIDRSGLHRALVLCISPQSLTMEAADNNGFLSLRKTGPFNRFMRTHLSQYLDFLKPYDFYSLYSLARGRRIMQYYQHLYADGWAASRKVPETPNYQISRYQGRFDNNKVSVKLQNQLFDHIRKWTAQGICVFGLRTPTSIAMVELENNESGFDHRSFAEKFEAVGGIWLNFGLTDYHSYDGSHLREDAARKFSYDLAAAMHAHWGKSCTAETSEAELKPALPERDLSRQNTRQQYADYR